MSVNLGTTTPSTYSIRPTQRQIVKASNGTYVLVANVNNDLVYKTSTDNGDTWDSSWTNIHTTSTYINDFDVYIDGSDNIHVVFYGLVGNTRIYYIPLTYSGGSWSVGSAVLVQAGATTAGVKFTIRSNGDYWIANTGGNLYYSTNSGGTWNTSTNPGSSPNIVSIIPVGSNLWLISQRSGGLYYYVYNGSWGSGTAIASSGILNNSYGIGVVKISDTNIWVSAKTSSGIQMYYYNGGWGTDALISDNSNDVNPCLSYVGSNPICTWIDYNGSQYDIVYRIYNGSSWDSPVNVTSDATKEKYLTAIENDDADIHITWFGNGSSPYTVLTEALTVSGDLTASLTNTLTLSDSWSLQTNPDFQDISDTILLSDDWVLQVDPDSQSISDTIILSDEWSITTSTPQESFEETFLLSDSWSAILYNPVDYASKILHYNPLIIVTDTTPAQIAIVDISDPENPSKIIYNLTGVSNANAVSYNASNGYIYAVADDGKVVKILASNPNSQSIIDTLDSNDLLADINIDTEFKTFARTDDSLGELILIDEAEVENLNLDIRFAKHDRKILPCIINTVLAKLINADIRFTEKNTSKINLDIRFSKYSYATVSQYPISISDWELKINDVDLLPLDDVDTSSIVITHYSGNQSSAQFILHRKHDNLNYTNAGTSSQITNNNTVKIYINNILEFNGKISNIEVNSQAETVTVTAKMNEPADKRHLVNIPLPSINESLNLYHCLVDDVSIDNPYIDSSLYEQSYEYGSATDPDIDDELDLPTPEYYKGVKIDLGTREVQKVSRWHYMNDVSDDIENGTFNERQNWSYFWLVSYDYKYINSLTGNNTTQTISSRYIGTSLSPLSSDVLSLNSAYYLYQREYENDVYDLGYSYLGNAPYLEVSATNGVLQTSERWEDREDGLYNVRDDYYNNNNYALLVAQAEYNKLKNINGDILPRSSANINLSLSAYYYYNLALLTRINITNTTTNDIYKNANGFPLAIKTIQISSSNMQVQLACDNALSDKELDEIDENLPDEATAPHGGYARKIYSKFNIASGGYVS